MPRMPRTVITFGTFDVFHVGHLRVLERAAALGDRLVVGISQATLTRRGQRSAMCSMIAVVEMAGVRSR